MRDTSWTGKDVDDFNCPPEKMAEEDPIFIYQPVSNNNHQQPMHSLTKKEICAFENFFRTVFLRGNSTHTRLAFNPKCSTHISTKS